MPFKLYIDSRFRQDTGGENSDSHFAIELPHPLNVKGTAFVDVVCLANSFYTIRAGENDRLHVGEIVFLVRFCFVHTELCFDANVSSEWRRRLISLMFDGCSIDFQ